MDDKFDVIEAAFKKYFHAEEVDVRISWRGLKVRVHKPVLISSAVIGYAVEEINESSFFWDSEIQYGAWEYRNGIFKILIKEF